ncbi:hypothetical protein Hanom_Chr12g01124041 [Helianthus anomalus]
MLRAVNEDYNQAIGILKAFMISVISGQTLFMFRVNFRFAPCGLVVLMVLPQSFKYSHFTP